MQPALMINRSMHMHAARIFIRNFMMFLFWVIVQMKTHSTTIPFASSLINTLSLASNGECIRRDRENKLEKIEGGDQVCLDSALCSFFITFVPHAYIIFRFSTQPNHTGSDRETEKGPDNGEAQHKHRGYIPGISRRHAGDNNIICIS